MPLHWCVKTLKYREVQDETNFLSRHHYNLHIVEGSLSLRVLTRLSRYVVRRPLRVLVSGPGLRCLLRIRILRDSATNLIYFPEHHGRG